MGFGVAVRSAQRVAPENAGHADPVTRVPDRRGNPSRELLFASTTTDNSAPPAHLLYLGVMSSSICVQETFALCPA